MKRALGLALLALSACGSDFIKGWQVDRPRVLGARVEGSDVSWLVARAVRTEWAYAVCADTKLSAPRCDTTILATGTGATDGEVVKMTPATLPPESLILAAFCTSGAATLDPVAFEGTCADGSPPLLASMKSGTPQPQPAPPELRVATDCVAPGSQNAIGFTFRAEDRDPGETLLASTTVTDGELERQYTALEPAEAAPKEVSIPWRAPAVAGTTSIYLVLRDGRGGTAFTSARVCVR